MLIRFILLGIAKTLPKDRKSLGTQVGEGGRANFSEKFILSPLQGMSQYCFE